MIIMKYNISINQKKSVEWELSTSEAIVFSWIYSLPSWSDSVSYNNGTYYFGSRNKACEELPIVTDKRDTTETIGDNTDETTANTRTTEDTGLEKQLEHYALTKKGSTGQWTYQDLIRKYRDLIINVDAMIMESVEIKSLFIYCE